MSGNKECFRDADIAVIQNNQINMANDIKETKEAVKDIFKEISSFKDFLRETTEQLKRECDIKYATRKEHEENLEKINEIEKTYKTGLIWTIWFLFAALTTLWAVIWHNLDKIVK